MGARGGGRCGGDKSLEAAVRIPIKVRLGAAESL